MAQMGSEPTLQAQPPCLHWFPPEHTNPADCSECAQHPYPDPGLRAAPTQNIPTLEWAGCATKLLLWSMAQAMEIRLHRGFTDRSTPLLGLNPSTASARAVPLPVQPIPSGIEAFGELQDQQLHPNAAAHTIMASGTPRSFPSVPHSPLQ